MKLRYKLGLTWLAIELATLPFAVPAFASFMDRVTFSAPQKAITLSHQIVPGQQDFIVSANAPFAVISKGEAVDMQVTISESGEMFGLYFGEKSQMPGAASHCAAPSQPSLSRIYTSQQKTAARRGTALEQAIKITVNYEAARSPEISVISLEATNEAGALLALNCANPLQKTLKAKTANHFKGL